MTVMSFSWPALAQNADTAFDQKQIELLQHDSSSAQAQAGKLKQQAAQYRELAESAERYAATAGNVKDKEEWLKTAKQHREKAEKLEQDAARDEDKAEDAAGAVTDLENIIDEKETKARAQKEKYDRESAAVAEREAAKQEAIDNNPNTGLRVANVIGLWRDRAHEDEPFVIVQKDPSSKAYQNRLEAHTTRRVWEGDMRTDPPPGEPLITMTYKPKAEEMNPEIPEWARKKIEGELEWKLEISGGGTCGTPTLAADFYPGEVKWEEKDGGGKGKVSIEGKGEAHRINMQQSVGDMRFYSYGAPQIYLRPTGMRPDKTDEQAEKDNFDFTEPFDTVDALVHGQRFHIDVILPEDEAKKQGETLTVTIKSAGGDKDTVDLRSGAMRHGRSVIYTHYDPITISDPLDVTVEDRDPPLLSINYILGYQGERIDLDVENNELVTFSYGEAYQTIPVFNTWIQRGINQHQEAIQRLRPFFSMVLADANTTKAQKEEATDRLIMIANYEHIMASEKIHDFIRYKVGEAYFNEVYGMVGMSDEDVQREAELTMSYHPLGADRDGNLNRTGIYKDVVWTSRYEMSRIENTVVKSRVEYRETALKELPLAMTMALYTTAMGMSGFGDIYTLRTGEDIYGKPAPGWARIQAACGLVFSNILTFTAPHVMTPPSLKAFNSSQLSGRAMRSGARMRYKTHEHINAKYGAQKLEVAMKKMSAAQADSVAPFAKAVETTPSTKPLPCPKARKNPGSVNMAQPPAQGISAPPPHPAPMSQNILSVRKMFGDSTKVLNTGKKLPLQPQKFGTCNCGAMGRSLYEDMNIVATEMGSYGMLYKKGHVKAGEMPLENGYNDVQAAAYVHEMGGEVSTASATKGRLTPEGQAFMMKQGWRVREVIFTMDTKEPHAVEIVEFVRNGNNEITDVRYYDPAHVEILETPICDFTNKLVAKGYDTFLYRWKNEAGQPIRTAGTMAPPPKPTIQYPAPRNPGSAAEGAPKPADQPEPVRKGFGDDDPDVDIDPDSIVQIGDDGKVLTREAQIRHEAEVKRLDRRIDELHPGETKPHLNTIPRESLKEIYKSGLWLPPRAGGAAFSRAGSGFTGRHEVVAIRVKPGHENFVEMVPTDKATGFVPRYWKSGKKGVGPSKDTVPAEHMEWIDGDQKTWVPFTERKLEADEFNLD